MRRSLMLLSISLFALVTFAPRPGNASVDPSAGMGPWGPISTTFAICSKCVAGFCDPVNNHYCEDQGGACVGTSLARCEVEQTRLDGSGYQTIVATLQQRQAGRVTASQEGVLRNCADEIIERAITSERASDIRLNTAALIL